MPALKDIQSLFFQQDLLIGKQIVRNFRAGFVGYASNPGGQRFRYKLRARRALHAMWRKCFEFRIVGNMEAAVRYQKYAFVARRLRQAANVGQQLFRARHVKLPSRKHEISLGVDLPENVFARNHCAQPAENRILGFSSSENNSSNRLGFRRNVNFF